MSPLDPRCEAVIARAAAEGRTFLLEHEGFALLEALGLAPPRWTFVPEGSAPDPAGLARLAGEAVVVKVVSPAIAHKSDVGGVRRAPRRPVEVAAVITAMRAEVLRRHAARHGAPPPLSGWLVCEEVPHRREPGHELLIGARHTDPFGPIVVLGTGGVHSELWARCLGGRAIALRAAGASRAALRAMLDDTVAGDFLLGRTRTGEILGDADEVTDVLARFAELALRLSPLDPAARHHLLEVEVNPFVVSDGRLRPVDVLVRFAPADRYPPLPLPRPPAGIERLLRPQSIAIAGVSEKGQNIGRIILGNLLRDGFPPDRIYVLKPASSGTIDGCRCVPAVAALPEAVDLLVVATAAPLVPALVEEVEREAKAASVLLIPGGMGEKQGTATIESRIAATIRRAREAGGGAVYNGGNSLGLRSDPGRCDTMFIPGYKLPPGRARRSNTALVSQSGAFAIARMSKQPHLAPRYALSIGNQIDLTFSDYLRYLLGDEEVEVVALYVEGFRPLDGLRTAEAIAALVAAGRDVVVYKAGRTAAGRSSTAGHTASIAGDYTVAAALLAAAGAWVADTAQEFEHATKLLSFLHRRPLRGRRIGAVSNAGFEAVALADNIEAAAVPLVLPPFAEATVRAINETFARSRLTEIIDAHNPLDVTPVSDDAAFAAHVEAVLADPGVDGVVVSLVPLSPALATLPAQPGVHREDVDAATSIAHRLVDLAARCDKPLVAAVDSGRLYDRLVDILEEGAIPTFREADTAMRLFAKLADLRLRRAGATGGAAPDVRAAEPSLTPRRRRA